MGLVVAELVKTDKNVDWMMSQLILKYLVKASSPENSLKLNLFSPFEKKKSVYVYTGSKEVLLHSQL